MDDEIRIDDILYVVWKSRVLILILAAIGLFFGIVLSIVSYAKGEISKEYAITTSLAVTSVTQDGLFTNRNSNTPNSADVYLAEEMVDSVIYVLKSDTLLKSAIEKMGLVGISTSDIASNLQLKQYNTTQIIEITLFWRSATEGIRILEAINQVAPRILIQTLKIGGVSIVNLPTARYRVGGNLNARLWLYMMILGIAAGAGYSVLKMLVAPTLLKSRDMEDKLGVVLLGEIPADDHYFAQKRSVLLADDNEASDAVPESFSAAAHIFQNMLGSEMHHILYVTSSTQNEGKTTVTAYLAARLADMEKKVLLIDFDVRNPTLGSLFVEKVDYVHSINALYRGDSTVEEAITHLTGYLDLLPAILERQELAMDDAMMDIVRDIASQYDYILIDTAPVGRVADSMKLNRLTKDVVFVAGFDSTGMKDIEGSLEKLDKSGVKVIGCIVNGVTRMGRHDRYSYGYGYGYGKRRSAPLALQTEETEEPVPNE